MSKPIDEYKKTIDHTKRTKATLEWLVVNLMAEIMMKGRSTEPLPAELQEAIQLQVDLENDILKVVQIEIVRNNG